MRSASRLALCQFAGDYQKALGGGGKRGVAAVGEAKFTLDAQVAHGHGDELLARQLFLHTHARHEGNAHSHRHELLDCLNGRQLRGYLKRRVVARERFNNALAVGR